MTDTTSEAPVETPVDGPLSADDAVLALMDTPEAPEPDQADTPPADDDADPLLAVLGEEETTDDPEKPVIDYPKSWGEDGRAAFEAAPRAVQEFILKREAERDSATHKALGEVTAAKKSAQQDAAQIAQVRAQLDAVVPQALQTFKSRWDGVDWAEWAQRDAIGAFQAKAQYDAEQQQLQQLSAAQAQAQATEHHQHVLDTVAELQRVAPELVDPKEGHARVSALTGFLATKGVAGDQLKWATASELDLAYKAMKYEALEAKAKSALTRIPAAPSKPVKPTGTPERASPDNQVTTIRRRFAQTGKADDAVALILAQGL